MESKHVLPNVYSPQLDYSLKKFNEFWDMPFDALIQEILDGKEHRLQLRIPSGINEASKEDQSAIRSWIDKLEMKKNSSALLSGAEWAVLGLCYHLLWNFSPEITSKKLHSFREAHAHGNHIGTFELSMHYQQTKDIANELLYLKLAAERGSAIAHYTLGLKVAKEQGDKMAIPYMITAVNGGDINGLHWFTYHYADNPIKAREYLERQVALGYQGALSNLAQQCLQGSKEFPPDITRAMFLYRNIAERQPGYCSAALSLWNYFLKSPQPAPSLIYHLAILMQRPAVKQALERESSYKRLEGEQPYIVSSIPIFFKKLVDHDFDAFNTLSNQEPWDNIKGLFSEDEASQIYSRKIKIATDVVIALERKGLSLDTALETYTLANSIHPSYLLNIEKAAQIYSGRKKELQDNFKQLQRLVEARINFLKEAIEKQLSKHFVNDSKLVRDYRKNHFTHVFNTDYKNLTDPIDLKVKSDEIVIRLYSELREAAQLYGPLTQTDPIKILLNLHSLLEKINSIPQQRNVLISNVSLLLQSQLDLVPHTGTQTTMLTTNPIETETKSSFPPANFDVILKQVDAILEKKYQMVKISLSGTLSSEQFLTLAAKIKTIENEWKPSINFIEYKAHYLKQKSNSDDPKSDYQLEQEFDALKARGRQWNLKVEATGDHPALVDFIVSQLQAKRIWSLKLNQLFSEKSFERIIYSCKDSAVGFISFGCKEQIITDSQGKILANCMSSGSLKCIEGLSGKTFSQETAEQFVAATRKKYYLEISDCPHYNERRRIECTIDDVNRNPYFGMSHFAFRSDDIVRLTKNLTNSSHPIQFHLSRGNYLDPQWINFFTQVLSSTTPVTELTISSSEVEISDDVMLAIVNTLGLNTTISKLTIFKFLNPVIANALASSFKLNTKLKSIELRTNESKAITNIVEALKFHPSLISLMLNESFCSGQGVAFQNLVSQNKTLQKLYLVHTNSDDDTITGIANGLEKNNTLKELYLGQNTFTDKGLIELADVIPKNEKLKIIWFLSSWPYFSMVGADYFVRQLQYNKSIVEAVLAYPPKIDDEIIKPTETLLNETLERNKQLAKQRQLEWELEYKQPYVETAILLFQAHRQNIGWKAMVILEKTLAFLAPHPSIVELSQTQRCTDLIRNNLFNRQWKTTLEAKVSHYGSTEIRMFTIFKKWPGCTVTFKPKATKLLPDKKL